MSKSNDAILQRAYELIEKDELEQAQEILAPLLEADASNASLWWVYTHAMRDRAIGQAALDRVLEIDPSYPGARELKADLQQIQAQEDEFAALRQGGNGSAPQKTAYDIDDWEDLQPAVESQRRSRAIGRGAIVVVLALAIVVAGLGLVVSGAVELPAWLTDLFPSPEPAVIVVAAPTGEANLGLLEVNATSLPAEAGAQAEMTAPAPEDDGAPEPSAEPATATVELATAEATAEPESTAEATAEATAEIVASPTPAVAGPVLAAFINLVAGNIDDFEIDSSTGFLLGTDLGATLVIEACAVPGPEYNGRIGSVMEAVVSTLEYIPKSVDAVGVSLLNCDDAEARARLIGVTVSDILDYAREEISGKDFQRNWQPLS